jgi:hypothetical protein
MSAMYLSSVFCAVAYFRYGTHEMANSTEWYIRFDCTMMCLDSDKTRVVSQMCTSQAWIACYATMRGICGVDARRTM